MQTRRTKQLDNKQLSLGDVGTIMFDIYNKALLMQQFLSRRTNAAGAGAGSMANCFAENDTADWQPDDGALYCDDNFYDHPGRIYYAFENCSKSDPLILIWKENIHKKKNKTGKYEARWLIQNHLANTEVLQTWGIESTLSLRYDRASRIICGFTFIQAEYFGDVHLTVKLIDIQRRCFGGF